MRYNVGDLTKIQTGKLDANASDENGAYPFFTCSKEVSRINNYAYDCECVLVAGNGDLNVKYYNGKFNAYQRTYIIENNSDKLHMRYLYYFFDKYVERLREDSIGCVIKYIKLGNLTDATLEVPEIPRQKEIVRVLDTIQSIISKRKKQLHFLETLVKSRFIELFGDCRQLANLKDVCKIITDGTHQPPVFHDSGIPFILVSNITENVVTYDTKKFISEEDYNILIKRTPIEKGDVLLSTVGSYGHPAIVKEDIRFCFQRHIAYLKPNKEVIASGYLHGALLSQDVQNQIETYVKGIAQKTLNLSDIKKIIIPLPNLAEQEQYISFVASVDKTREIINKSLHELETLYASQMQEYFS